MDKGKITAHIDELRAPILKKLEASEEKTIRRLMQGQEFDIRQLYHPDGGIKKPHELDDDTARAIVGVRYDKVGNILEYKITDVKGCSELLGKHLKLFTDKVEQSGGIEVAFTRRIIRG
ncbi:MAG: terminase small subunit [Proteobacteria bacterium]|nr:terminase small subunit [Pseudomonadota bacterium]MBU0968815.1 terminase small subunit [Pseudomonadota bacterium]